jgi:hypothetical protein
MEILYFILPFTFLVFIALTYDKTVTPTVNWFKKSIKGSKNTALDGKVKQGTAIKYFNLYDSSIIILPIGLAFLTYEAFDPAKSFEQKIIAIPSILLIWILILFKIYRIEVIDAQTIIFRGIFRKIQVKPNDILSVQDWLRGIRVVLKKRSLILWPFIEKQGEFKSLMSNLNPDIEIKDMSNEATKSKLRAGLIILGMFLYFAGLIWLLFFNFTHNLK